MIPFSTFLDLSKAFDTFEQFFFIIYINIFSQANHVLNFMSYAAINVHNADIEC